MNFTKMHGCGNDYIYINGFEESVENKPATARSLSDRHFGIGSDGIIFINPSDRADFEMEMYNADGSRGKMCGNGIRCVGKYVYDRGLTKSTAITVETLSGIKTLDLNVTDGKVESVRVDMGEPIFSPDKMPLNAEVFSGQDRVIGQNLLVDGKDWTVSCISMGNPHAVVFLDNVADMEIEKIGPEFENHIAFPERVNTEFIRVIDRRNLEMRVWERGSGETLACGTGACAAAVASILNGFSDNEVCVHLLGGNLDISWMGEGSVFMTGPAVTVFEGVI